MHLVLRLRGGGAFADVSSGMMINGVLTKNGPKFRTISNGLNTHGICTNQQCKAYNQEVICIRGIKIYDIDDESECPLCYKIIKATTCGFYYNCVWKFDGMKEDGTIVNSELNSTENEYKYFDNTKTINWKYLVFTILELNQRAYTISKGKVYNDTCPICLDDVTNGCVKLSCCHQFHQNCIDEWFATGSVKCPLCNK